MINSPPFDMERMYQKMILAFGRAGLRNGSVRVLYSKARQPEGFRFIPINREQDDIAQVEFGEKYDLVAVLERVKGRPSPALPTYVELNELIQRYLNDGGDNGTDS